MKNLLLFFHSLLFTANAAMFEQDSLQAKETYKKHFGTEPLYFAYPYGYGIPKTDEILLNQKYDLIFSLYPGVVKTNDPSFFIKRILVEQNTWKEIEKWVHN